MTTPASDTATKLADAQAALDKAQAEHDAALEDYAKALTRRATLTREWMLFFEQYAVDVAIVDVIWNGMLESLRIAAMAEPYQVNVAPHNFYGHLCSYISANFCAAIPNFVR